MRHTSLFSSLGLGVLNSPQETLHLKRSWAQSTKVLGSWAHRRGKARAQAQSLLTNSASIFYNYLFIFRERGEKEKEKERNIHWLPLAHSQLGTWPATQACALPENETSKLLVRRPMFDPLSHTNQGIKMTISLMFLFYLLFFYLKNLIFWDNCIFTYSCRK